MRTGAYKFRPCVVLLASRQRGYSGYQSRHVKPVVIRVSYRLRAAVVSLPCVQLAVFMDGELNLGRSITATTLNSILSGFPIRSSLVYCDLRPYPFRISGLFHLILHRTSITFPIQTSQVAAHLSPGLYIIKPRTLSCPSARRKRAPY